MTFAVNDPFLKAVGSLTNTPLPHLNPTPHQVLWTENKSRLLFFPATGPARGALFLSYAMINRFYILDLMPGRSVVEFLAKRGIASYLLDWGVAGPEDRLLTMEHFVDGVLVRAMREARLHAGVDALPVVGYCQGGLYATIVAALHPELVKSLVTVATPIDFAVSSELAEFTTQQNFDVDAMVDGLGNVPGAMIQSGFLAMQPTVNVRKYQKLAKIAKDPEAVGDFLALESWSTDGVPFPGECYRKYIHDFYQDNKLIHGTFELGGRRVDLKNIHCPLLVVSASQDPIVSVASGEALLPLVSSARKETLVTKAGHIGIAVSPRSLDTVWSRIADFVVGGE